LTKLTLLEAKANKQIANEVIQPMRSTSSTMSAVNTVNAVKNLASAVAGRPSFEYFGFGFRVASLSSSAPPAVPEPSMMVTGMLFGLGGASRVDDPAAYHADNVLYLSPEPILDNA